MCCLRLSAGSLFLRASDSQGKLRADDAHARLPATGLLVSPLVWVCCVCVLCSALTVPIIAMRSSASRVHLHLLSLSRALSRIAPSCTVQPYAPAGNTRGSTAMHLHLTNPCVLVFGCTSPVQANTASVSVPRVSLRSHTLSTKFAILI